MCMYRALVKNMILKEQIKQKLGKYIREKAETNNVNQCRVAEAKQIRLNKYGLKIIQAGHNITYMYFMQKKHLGKSNSQNSTLKLEMFLLQ